MRSATVRILISVAAMCALAAADLVEAAVITVTTIDDTNDGVCDEHCSLREAIAAATDGDTIGIPAGTYTLTLGDELLVDKDLALSGAAADQTIIQAATQADVADFRVFNINGSTVVIQGVTIRHGNGFGVGGGVYSHNHSDLTLLDSAVSDNTAFNPGGGIYTSGSAGSVTLVNCVVNGNTSTAGGGGGISNEQGTMTITNSTISGNTTGQVGGGVYNSGTLTLIHVTVSGNHCDTFGGGGIRAGSSSDAVELINTIVAGNTATTGAPDCSGVFTSLGHNLIGDTTECDFTPAAGDLVGVDPLLGPLQGNGGPTETHALLPGSPAIDAGGLECEATDQRGVPRPQDGDGDGVGECDIGAFELQGGGDDDGGAVPASSGVGLLLLLAILLTTSAAILRPKSRFRHPT
jgi:CSLREA domain-containing protein